MRIGTYRGRIVNYVCLHKDCTLKDISKDLNIGYNYVSTLTKELCEVGHINCYRDKKTRIKHYR